MSNDDTSERLAEALRPERPPVTQAQALRLAAFVRSNPVPDTDDPVVLASYLMQAGSEAGFYSLDDMDRALTWAQESPRRA